MPTYSVRLPISGVIDVEIEAEDENDAIEKALLRSDLTIDDVSEWEAVRQIVTGNVFRGHTNKADAQEV